MVAIEDILSETMNDHFQKLIGYTVKFKFYDENGSLRSAGIMKESGEITLKVEKIRFVEDDGNMWLEVNDKYNFPADSGTLCIEVIGG